MKKSNIQIVKYRRRREGKTNYNKRIKTLTSNKLRLVIRKTNTKIVTQVIKFDIKGDIVKLGVDSTALIKLGWKGSTKNLCAAYLTGYLIGKKALEAGIKEAVLDTGLITSLSGSKIYSALKGVVDAGLNVPCSEEVFPTEDRINGKHIKDFANKIEEIKGKIK
ncbi:50S ribosomal protein L18 [Candidatus Woesearchaeota archaeon]|jgi:large subunit ribosomal protein L18|nr:50S ribosomal protein L18 [Candidatus Woesearchaeota archaeon]MBT4368701.1 50S ribosomal protein L18 [Candidatus Woesearchaeota archaeon]MBT4711990.1 50S ribosomal protein L18 [Candidatus Woesearchaeota archaeon]MBT6638885.1 50S ribosomal protein L18 [Candidatus Woesearchaeota archaeon]MBT7134529.1 50S ribosomal protein L18 [Candidatus Woesearchaeota archaeon]